MTPDIGFDYLDIAANFQVRTNLTAKTQGVFSNGSFWTLTQTTVVDNSATAPDGTATASVLTDNTVSNPHELNAVGTLAYVAGTTYTMSCFVKASSLAAVQLTFPSAQFSGVGFADFDLSSGAVSFTGGTLAASGSQTLANGWYRIWVAATATASGSGTSFVLFTLNSTTGVRAATYIGTTQSVNIWGCQTEVGAFPSRYTPSL